MSKQKFKGQIFSEKKCINSILRFHSLATIDEIKEGIRWYEDANIYCKELANRFNISIQQACGIIAVFSPQAGWTENKRYALSFLLQPNIKNRSLVQMIKAKKILLLKSESEIYNILSTREKAFKTKAFFVNLLNPDIPTGCTIDRHAIAICLQSPNNTFPLDQRYGDNLTIAQYSFLENCYVKCAKDLGIFPHQLQAITWLTYRRIRDLKEHVTVNEWQPFNTDIEF